MSGRARAGKGPAGPRGSIPVLGWGRERAGDGGGGALAASGGGRRDCCTGDGGLMQGTRDGW
jgi:hypothetical protein